jgi:single-stranded-DNA-specific exonuclease
MQKRWIVKETAPAEFLKTLAESPPLVASLLWNRGIKEKEQIREFLEPTWERDVHDPFLFRDMKKTVGRIFKAVDEKEKITIFADYDADGVPAGTILATTLREYGFSADIYTPHRETEGYGLNTKAIEYLAGQGVKVIITCDCGISNTAEISFAAEKGIDVIVTDHHQEPAELPAKAFSIIHPKISGESYPCKFLSGGAVAFKLAQALLKTRPVPGGEAFEKRLTEFAAIALVADMVPILGEARTLTNFGLRVLNKTTRIGLKKLYETAGIVPGTVTTTIIGFQIAPRINAAGRMDHANGAVALLNATDEEEAARLAIALNDTNAERQRVTKTVTDEVREQILATGQEDAPVLVTYNEKWPAGLLGLVSGKIVEEFNRPAFVFTKKNETELVGSGRSIPAWNLILAMQKIPDAFLRFGGHIGAAGMSIAPEKFDDFKKRIVELAANDLAGKDLTPSLNVDAEILLSQIDWELEKWLAKFEPHGMENRVPLFVSRGLSIVSADAIGSSGQHLRLSLCENEGKPQKCIAFKFGQLATDLAAGDKVDVVYEISVNEWNGRRELQLKIADLTKIMNNGQFRPDAAG